MQKGVAYLFRPSTEIKHYHTKKSDTYRMTIKNAGGLVLKVLNGKNVFIVPFRVRTFKKEHDAKLLKTHAKDQPYIVRWVSAPHIVDFNCEFFYRVNPMVLRSNECFKVLPLVRERIYVAFNNAKQQRSDLHRRLRALKNAIVQGELNNIDIRELRSLQRQRDFVICKLGYSVPVENKTYLAPYEPSNKSPLRGGGFSPR